MGRPAALHTPLEKNEPGGLRPPVVTYSEPNQLRLTTRVSYFLAFRRRRFFVAFLAFFLARFFAMDCLLDWLMYRLGITCLDSAQPSACCWG